LDDEGLWTIKDALNFVSGLTLLLAIIGGIALVVMRFGSYYYNRAKIRESD
jgi:flagellar biogenesis protein FliO